MVVDELKKVPTLAWISLVKECEGLYRPKRYAVVFMTNPNFFAQNALQHSKKVDYWVDPVGHLFVLKTSMT